MINICMLSIPAIVLFLATCMCSFQHVLELSSADVDIKVVYLNH